MSPLTTPRPAEDPRADEAIAAVLGAEKQAQDRLLQLRQQGQQQLEAARATARRTAQRTEARIRAVVAAFKRETARQLAEIDRQTRAMASVPDLSADEQAALDEAVRRLARQLTGVAP